MKAVRQEHFSGCAVACLASITRKPYKKAIKSFTNGTQWAKFRGFYCKEIIEAFKLNNLDYQMRYVGRKTTHVYPIGTIVFLKKDSRYPTGHYICFTDRGWILGLIFQNWMLGQDLEKLFQGDRYMQLFQKKNPDFRSGSSNRVLEEIQIILQELSIKFKLFRSCTFLYHRLDTFL